MFKWLKKLFKKKQKTSVNEFKVKQPIYTMGSADPKAFTCSYRSFTGVDIKVVFLDCNEKLYSVYTQPNKPPEIIKNGMPTGAAQSFHLYGGDDKQTGSISFILFDDMDQYYNLQGTEKRVYISAANEFGNLSVLFDGIIKFSNYLQWGVSIDDVVTEVHLEFEVISQKINGHHLAFETKHEMIEYLKKQDDLQE